MKHDAIEINGKRYRIEFNWNAISCFLDATGLGLESLEDPSKMKPSEITELLFQSVVEGCRMDQEDFPFNKVDFGAALDLLTIAGMMKVFTNQVQSNTTLVIPKKK